MQADENLALKPTRASFIRSLPEAMPVDEVIERGREVGLVINPSDVHSVRYYMRQVNKGQPQRKPTSTSTASTATSTTTTSTLERGIAATVKRNYELIEAHQADESSPEPAPSVTPSTFAKKKRGTNGVESTSRSQLVVRARPKRLTAMEVRSMEQQLRTICSRIGTDRVREILDELEALPIE
jgi:hypothetical protein